MPTVRIDVAAHANPGETLMSRGQARMLAVAIPASGQVELDYSGVERIGPSFADELFRVFAIAHPGVTLATVNMSGAVASMVRRARASDLDGRVPPG